MAQSSLWWRQPYHQVALGLVALSRIEPYFARLPKRPIQILILPDGQITSDFQKWCQAPFAKIFLFSSDPNQFTDSHCLVPTRGAYRDRHERGAGCGGRGQRT